MNILFIASAWDSLGATWYLCSHAYTVLSSLLVIKYNRDPIMAWYFLISKPFPFSSTSSWMVQLIGVAMLLAWSTSNFFKSSFIYFVYEMDMSFFFCLICNPRKNLSSPIINISNSPFIILETLAKIFISGAKNYIININLNY